MVLIGFNNLIKKENKMFYFYLNKNAQPSGEHEIHKDKCSYLPHPFNREYLGYLSNFSQAKEVAKESQGCLILRLFSIFIKFHL